jgi:23S rRNA (cytosine1962-C5)-methyltransferase
VLAVVATGSPAHTPAVPAPSLAALVAAAWQRRGALHDDPSTDAYRIFHGYGEGRRGLKIDRYGEAVIAAHKVDLAVDPEELVAALDLCHPFRLIVLRSHRRRDLNPMALRVAVLRGDPLPDVLEVREDGLRFLVNPSAPDNPGLFLDARPARRWIRENSAGRRILNLFAYTGSLGVAAAAGGARSVTHVDALAAPLERAHRNHALNGLPVDDRSLMRGNVYRHLPRAARSGVTFDGIILDPPPQVPARRGHRPRGQDFPTLTRLAAPLLAPGGWLLCFFSRYDQPGQCGESEVREAAPGPLAVIWRGTSGPDFPELEEPRKLRLVAFQRPE